MKRFLSTCLALVMLVGLCAVPGVMGSAGAFRDVADEDLELKLGTLQMIGVISGFEDGTFRPNQNLTRAQFCKMTVVIMSKEEQRGLYQNFTIYPDVRSSHWASGDINMAVKELKLIQGFPDGTFKPEDSVTYAQAVTILMRALGYTDKDVGLVWPAGYLAKAADIGLTKDLSLGASDALSRGDGARLFFNLLSVYKKGGTAPFLESIGSSSVPDVTILDNNASASDGTPGAVEYRTSSSNTIKKTRNPMPDIFVGRHGTLRLDASGDIAAFLPDNTTRKTVIVSEARADGLKASDGEFYAIPDYTATRVGGKEEPYSTQWLNIKKDMVAEMTFGEDGKVSFLLISNAVGGSGTKTLVLNGSHTDSQLASLFNVRGTPAVLKNGTASSGVGTERYDVATYNPAAGLIIVSSFKLTGIIEAATPNLQSPQKIQILGQTFPVLEDARSSFAGFKYGDAVTLLFTSSTEVAGVVSKDELSVYAFGLDTGAGIKFPHGPTLTFSSSSGTNGQPAVSPTAGTLVSVSQQRAGEVSISAISVARPVAINFLTGKVGSRDLHPQAVFYESVGGNGKVVEIERSDIVSSSIKAEQVRYAFVDSQNRVTAVWLDNATHDTYTYGQLYYETASTSSPGVGGNAITTSHGVFSVKNSSGTKVAKGKLQNMSPGWGGLAITRDNQYAAHLYLTPYNNVTRASFIDNTRVTIDGVSVPISKDVQVYITQTGTYLSGSGEALIQQARAQGITFRAHLDGTPFSGAKVRILEITSLN
ncbi:S-layer homology domain-containing protein [Oscillospiraceae bacterium OttesenSCG-928-F05]|nr:S-layer homology domain-containing protein [Oscillospiraceae bacterium OttesenSCG-928-F05]